MIRVLTVLLCGALPLAAWAAPPPDDLGRLFTTPEQRTQLDLARRPPPPPPPMPVVVETVPVPRPPPEPEPVVEPPPELPKITINGVVVRDDGNNTAWINGTSTTTGDVAGQPVRVDTRRLVGERVRVETPERLPDLLLKPGESVEPHGVISDVYQAPVGSPSVASPIPKRP